MKKYKKALYILAISAFSLVFFTWLCYHWVDNRTDGLLFNSLDQVPENKVGLVLGTSNKLVGGWRNPYFYHRIAAAAELFHAGKVKYLIASGDNSLSYYNEPEDMAKALVAQGVPDSVIFRDYAGFRTLDSVIRAKAIFGQDSYTIISQPFHNSRAVFIARQKGMNAIGYNAKDLHISFGLKIILREYLARVNMVLDLYILEKEPKFYGDPVEIP